MKLILNLIAAGFVLSLLFGSQALSLLSHRELNIPAETAVSIQSNSYSNRNSGISRTLSQAVSQQQWLSLAKRQQEALFKGKGEPQPAANPAARGQEDSQKPSAESTKENGLQRMARTFEGLISLPN